MIEFEEKKVPILPIREDFLIERNINLFLLREDLIHPYIPGNKWRKLKYNLLEASNTGFKRLLTYGGAYSNHIAAVSSAGNLYEFETIGIIRGRETLPLNHTLRYAVHNGMRLKYISNEEYRGSNKYNEEYINELKKEYGTFYLIPEGGTNNLAIKGCREIISGIDAEYDIICCSCGTGGTIAGIINSVDIEKEVLGFSSLKGGFLKDDIIRLLQGCGDDTNGNMDSQRWNILTDYHFGGYAKITPELVEFVRDFRKKHDVLLDLVYTGKMMFGLFDQIKSSEDYNNKNIIAVHTGGTQGNQGYFERLGIRI